MIILLADLHLTRLVWKSRPELEGDSFRALEQVHKKILKLQAESGDEKVEVVLAGDIFDNQRVDGASLSAFTNFVDNLYDEGITVHFIQGNHDRDSVKAIAEIQGAVHIHKRTVTLDGLTFYGLDWMPREELLQEIAVVPECDYLVLHCMMEHMMDFEAAADLSLEEIPPHVKNIFVGDIHIRNETPMHGDGWCISPGPLHACNITQAPPHGFHVIEKGQWRREDIRTREVLRYECLEEQYIQPLREALEKLDKQAEPTFEPIVEIRFSSEFATTIQDFVDLYRNVRIFPKASAKGKMLSQEDLKEAQASANEITLENSLDAVVDPKKEQELYDFVHGLLTSPAAKELVESKLEGIECVQSV